MFMIYITKGPFTKTWLRAQVIDYSISFFTDEITGYLALELEKDPAILAKAFDWRIWVGVLTVLPLYIVIICISDWTYNGNAQHWWYYCQFCLRSICMDSVKIPQKQNYNKVSSIVWIWSSFILFTAYQGISYCFHSPNINSKVLLLLLATLVSLIAKPGQPYLMSSIEELVWQDEISWLIEAGSQTNNIGMDADQGTTLKYGLKNRNQNILLYNNH